MAEWRTLDPLGGEINKCRGLQRVPLEDKWIKAVIEKIVATLWLQSQSPQSRADDERVPPPLPEDGRSTDQPRQREPELRAPQRPRIAKSDLSRWGYTDGCFRCRQMRSGRSEDGTKHNERCFKRIANEMRKANDPRIQQSEDIYTAYEDETMRAKDDLTAEAQTAAHGRRGGVGVGGSGEGVEVHGRAEYQVPGGAEDQVRGKGCEFQAQGQVRGNGC